MFRILTIGFYLYMVLIKFKYKLLLTVCCRILLVKFSNIFIFYYDLQLLFFFPDELIIIKSIKYIVKFHDFDSARTI